MGLLVQVPTLARAQGPGGASVSLGIVAATAVHPPIETKLPQRADVKARHFAKSYEHVIARLSRIPVPLPYNPAEIVARLREVDRLPKNRELVENRLELETDIEFAVWDIERPSRDLKARERRERRLAAIWDFLNAHADRTQILVREREGRLGYAVEMFFHSDLPPSYLAEYGSSTHWELAELMVAANATSQRLVQRLTGRPAEEVSRDIFMESDASLQEIDRSLREYRRRFGVMAALGDAVLAWRDSLEYYVDLFSAPNLESFRAPRRISVSSLDLAVVDELIEGLRSATTDLRKGLAAEYPGGLSEIRWFTRNDSYLGGLIRMELEAAQAG